MAEETNLGEQAAPPRQTPFKPAVQAAGAPAAALSHAEPAGTAATEASSTGAPRTVILRRPTLRRPGEAPKSPISPISPKTVTLKPPVGTQSASQALSKTDVVAKGIAISHSDAAKKVTSRISVSSATSPIPPVDETPAPKPAEQAKPVASPLQLHKADADSPKKVTSRITLESAFSAQPDAMPAQANAAPAQPKTIRLKRPSEAAAATPPSVPARPAVAAPAESHSVPEGMTPISEIEGQSSSEEPLTRRKTIKVKRPGAPSASSGPKISIPRPDGVASESDNLQSLSNFAAGARPKGNGDKVNPFFIVAAVFAIVFASLLIWVLSSQTYGQRGAAGDYALPKGPSISPPPWLKTFD